MFFSEMIIFMLFSIGAVSWHGAAVGRDTWASCGQFPRLPPALVSTDGYGYEWTTAPRSLPGFPGQRGLAWLG